MLLLEERRSRQPTGAKLGGRCNSCECCCWEEAAESSSWGLERPHDSMDSWRDSKGTASVGDVAPVWAGGFRCLGIVCGWW